MKYLRAIVLLFFSTVFITACLNDSSTEQPILTVKDTTQNTNELEPLSITYEVLYNKVLGMLVGSAIGDAMGAPTEMWSRSDIQLNYGHVDRLDEMIRAPSPEGTWNMNLPAGGTTDDTRWKVLLTHFITKQGKNLYQQKGDYPFDFANLIVNQYLKEIDGLKKVDSFEPAAFEQQAMRMAWLQEWALVAKPFTQKDMEGYSYALNRFYGGEVTCAGMLYAPMIGLAFPGNNGEAYAAAYRLGFFDLGYARDLTGLTAAMVAVAMNPKSKKEDLITVLKNTDPQQYFESRLVGRSSYRLLQQAQSIVHDAKKLTKAELEHFKFSLPIQGRDALHVAQIQLAYQAMDQLNQDMAFHASEIHLINLVALLFCDYDFTCSLEFIINYGRDNDTVGAITGAILGAFYGYQQLPKDWAETVINTNKNKLSIDLEAMAQELCRHLINTDVVDAQLPDHL